MDKHTQAIADDISQLAHDARALMVATADVAGGKIGEARERLGTALERCKEFSGRARDKAMDGCRATDAAVHEYPYQAIAIGVGVGALVGFLLVRRLCRSRN